MDRVELDSRSKIFVAFLSTLMSVSNDLQEEAWDLPDVEDSSSEESESEQEGQWSARIISTNVPSESDVAVGCSAFFSIFSVEPSESESDVDAPDEDEDAGFLLLVLTDVDALPCLSFGGDTSLLEES